MKNLEITKLGIPFPAIAIDNFMSPSLLRAAANSFPSADSSGKWLRYAGKSSDNMHLKLIQPERSLMTLPALTALDYVAIHFDPTEYFKEFDIDVDVFPDFEYYAAGMHVLPENGFLGMHIDTDIHSGNKIWRREYSAVLCASEEYDSTFDLLLHNEKEHSRVPYKFNRLMVFKCSGNTWHGVPNPITSGMTRKTLAVFYWSLIDDNENVKDNRQRSYFRDDLTFDD